MCILFHFFSCVLLFTSLIINKAKSLQPYFDSEVNFATSPIDFKNLVDVESRIVLHALRFLAKCNGICSPEKHPEIQTLREYTQDFESTLLKDVGVDFDLFLRLSNHSIFDFNGLGENGSKHPLKIYRTIRRIVQQLPIIINSKVDLDLTILIHQMQKHHKFPTESDLETSILNVLRINQLFKLSFSEFLKGNVSNIHSNCGLTLEHLVEMGKVAIKYKLYSQSVDLFAIALWDAVKTDRGPQVEIFDLLQVAIKDHDAKIQGSLEIEDIRPESGPVLFDNLLHNISHPNFKFRTRVKQDTILASANYSDEDARRDVIVNGYKFEKLCSGEEMRTPIETKNLKCYLSSKSHPEFILKPLKIEVHNENPLLLQYHEVISDEDVERYKHEVKGELRTSRTINAGDDTLGQLSLHRSSSNSWIEDFLIERFEGPLHRIGRVIGVNTEEIIGSENLQVAAYSPGGHYVPHTDAVFEEEVLHLLDPSEFSRGDRILTFMIYLSDVEEGGGTAFPILNTSVKPKKGSGMMWYNLHPDGTIDRRTLHGGCSVVMGVKWIANKWIRSDDQMFVRQCPSSRPTSWSKDIHI